MLPYDYDTGILSPAHHLVYFLDLNFLQDVRDSRYSPGPPFKRIMRTKGSVAFMHDISRNGQPFHSCETIEDIRVSGKGKSEKISVQIKRCVFAGRYPREVKNQLSPKVEIGPSSKMYIEEEQTVEFMRSEQGFSHTEESSTQLSKVGREPEFSHTIVPTRELLFRFSALTFNAHAVHLDKAYCREVEGHRNLLVQKPLTLVLMIEVLRSFLRMKVKGRVPSPGEEPEEVVAVRYVNMMPLYVDEEIKICVIRMFSLDNHRKVWHVWIQGPDGRYAVKADADTWSKSYLASRRAEGDVPNIDQSDGLDEETIPTENVELQNEAIAGWETFSSTMLQQKTKNGSRKRNRFLFPQTTATTHVKAG